MITRSKTRAQQALLRRRPVSPVASSTESESTNYSVGQLDESVLEFRMTVPDKPISESDDSISLVSNGFSCSTSQSSKSQKKSPKNVLKILQYNSKSIKSRKSEIQNLLDKYSPTVLHIQESNLSKDAETPQFRGYNYNNKSHLLTQKQENSYLWSVCVASDLCI